MVKLFEYNTSLPVEDFDMEDGKIVPKIRLVPTVGQVNLDQCLDVKYMPTFSVVKSKDGFLYKEGSVQALIILPGLGEVHEGVVQNHNALPNDPNEPETTKIQRPFYVYITDERDVFRLAKERKLSDAKTKKLRLHADIRVRLDETPEVDLVKEKQSPIVGLDGTPLKVVKDTDEDS